MDEPDFEANLAALHAQNDMYMPQLRKLNNGLVLLDRLQHYFIQQDIAKLMWVLPPTVAPDITEFYGIPVHHAEVPGPMLAHRFDLLEGDGGDLAAALQLADELDGEYGPVTEAELEALRKRWPNTQETDRDH